MGIILATANQVSGINAIFFYAKQLFTVLTNNDQSAVLVYLFGLGIFQLVLTYVGAFLLDKFGRRSLMLIGMLIMDVSLFAVFAAKDIFGLPPPIVAFMIFTHLLGYSISLGPIVSVYAS